MMQFLAQAAPESNFWGKAPGEVVPWLIGAFILGIAFMFLLIKVPTRARRPIIWVFTFFAGAFFVLKYLWPEPISREVGQLPNNFKEGVGFWIEDATPWVANIANILTTFLLGLGIFSLVRIHLSRFRKMRKDWQFSLILLISMAVMIFVGYVDWYQREFLDLTNALARQENWGFFQSAGDLLFDGLIQQMDAAMFSMIAFFILSAAYRAFRIKSIEATVMMASALILMLSLMGAIDYALGLGVDRLVAGASGEPDPGSFWNNLRLFEVAGWLKSTMQVPSLRALDFGVGLGALAMGLRLWLGLEKGGVTA